MVPSGQGRLRDARRCQHHPIGLVPGHHGHRYYRFHGEAWLLCSGNATFPSPVLHWRRLAFNPLAKLRPQRLDRLPDSLWLRTWLWLPDFDLARPECIARADVPLGLALMFTMQQLGGSVFLAVSQNIFSSRLVDSLSGIAGLDTEAIVNTGGTALRTIVPLDQLKTVTDAYSHALTRVFIFTAALSTCMILGSLAVQWKRVKGKNETEGRPKSPHTEFEDSKGDAKPPG